jgi:hypothetical protein
MAILGGLTVLALTAGPVAAQMKDMDMKGMDMKGMHTSTPFAGPKANKGTVSHAKMNGKSTLTLSDDFVVPDTPDPHWRLVDSDGRVYDLDRLKVKDDKYIKSIEIPGYVKNVVKVVIWCAWAEANLGEASFSKPVK